MKITLSGVIFYMLILFIPSAYSGDSIELSPEEKEWVAEGHTVRVRVGNWPPYQIHMDGKLVGISVDYIERIFKQHGIRYELVSSDEICWKDAIEDIRHNNKIDLILAANNTPEREEDMLFTYEYINPPRVIYTRDSENDISSFEDLYGKTIAIQESFAVQRILSENYPQIKQLVITGTNTTAKALKALAMSQADAFIGNTATGSYLVKSLGLHNIMVAGVTPLGDDNNAMAVRKDWPELVSIINKSLLNFSPNYKSSVINTYYSLDDGRLDTLTDIVFWAIVTVVLLGGIIIYIVFVNIRLKSEIVRRKAIEYELNEYLSIIDENVISITVNAECVITEASKAYCLVSKTDKADLIGKNFMTTWSADMPDGVFTEISSCVASGQKWYGEIKKVASDGREFWINTCVFPKYDYQGHLQGYVSIGQDITDKKLVEKLSVTDSVTDIYNRLKLDEMFAYELEQSKRYSHVFSVVIVDIDDFKSVNDLYGHQKGDKVLKEISGIILNSTRVVDTVGRWGGDEFLLICPETDLNSVRIIGEKIRMRVGANEIEGVGVKTVSIGVASYEEGDSIVSMLDRADMALYRAKSNGKNKVCY